MTLVVLALIGALQTSASSDAFLARCDLQGLYDEMASAAIASKSARDIDMFHDVFYDASWAFIDAQKQRHDWSEMRQRRIDELQQPLPETIRLAIDSVTTTPTGATALVHLITVRRVTDADGRYGRPGLVHTIAETTPVRDTWIRSGSAWRLRLREQLGAPAVLIDKLPAEIENPRCPTH